tara:strand:- start:4492 stop:5616 length:1125 start_codon:yes stop_codon:yes gene_type:complete
MINFYPNLFDLYLVPCFFILGFLVIYKIKLLTDLSFVEINFIYLYHTFMCLVYYYMTINNPNDSFYYYSNVFHESFVEYNFKFGTPFTQSFIKLIVMKLNSTLFPLFIFFNIIGSLGLIFIYNAFRKIKNKNNVENLIIIFICFLPSLYFWSSAVGKEPFTFLATGLLLNSFSKNKIKFHYIAIAFLLLLTVRPFMAGFLVIAVAVGLIIKPNKYILITFPFIATFSITFMIYIIFYLKRLNINIFNNFEGFVNFINTQKSNTYSNEFTDMTNEGFFYHFFSYIFRPLPFEKFDFLSLLSGTENIILIIITFICLKKINIRNIYNNNLSILFIYTIICCFFLVIATYNLGVAIRQKWFFLIPLFFILLGNKQTK